MKRWITVLLFTLILSGCSDETALINRAVNLRNAMLSSNSYSFDATITADYGDTLHEFEIKCQFDTNQNMTLTVIKPDSISGITGKITGETGQLTFDDQALMFEMIADGQIAPICAPWLLVKALCSGYISSCGEYDGGLCIKIDDTFRDAEFCVEIWTGEENLPIRGEIIWQGRRILSVGIDNFVIV